jgi:hypothetical protein
VFVLARKYFLGYMIVNVSSRLKVFPSFCPIGAVQSISTKEVIIDKSPLPFGEAFF